MNVFLITEDFFNRVELRPNERIDGRDLLLGGRVIERRRDGSVVRDETIWNVRVLGGADYA